MAGEKKKKKNKLVKWIIPVIILILIIVLATQCGKTTEDVGKNVDVAEVVKGKVSSTMDTSGTIQSENSKVYTSPVNAKVAEVNLKVGDPVKAGDYIVTYDTSSLEDSYTKAQLEAKSENATKADTIDKSNESAKEAANQENTIQSINGQIDTIKADLTNIQNALQQSQTTSATVSSQLEDYKKKIENVNKETSQEDVEAWKSASEGLSAQLAQLQGEQADLQGRLESQSGQLTSLQTDLATAEAKKETATAAVMSANAKASIDYSKQATSLSLDSAESDLSKAKSGVVAEFDGIVTSVEITSGAAAVEGQNLVTIADTSTMKVEFEASRYILESLKEGQKAKITSLEHEYNGSVSKIGKMATMMPTENSASASAGKTSTSKVPADVHIDNPDQNLILGLDADIRISLGDVKDVLVVPLTAVNKDKEGDFVYLVDKNVIKRQPVTVGLYGDDKVEIKDGLKKGDHVVTVVDTSIEEGMAVVENLVKE